MSQRHRDMHELSCLKNEIKDQRKENQKMAVISSTVFKSTPENQVRCYHDVLLTASRHYKVRTTEDLQKQYQRQLGRLHVDHPVAWTPCNCQPFLLYCVVAGPAKKVWSYPSGGSSLMSMGRRTGDDLEEEGREAEMNHRRLKKEV